MNSIVDWRYDNLKRLHGATFHFAAYARPSEQWDHDHCCGCMAKFADFEGADILHEGYVYAKPSGDTLEPPGIDHHCIPAPIVNGTSLHWVCASCFADFRAILDFHLATS